MHLVLQILSVAQALEKSGQRLFVSRANRKIAEAVLQSVLQAL